MPWIPDQYDENGVLEYPGYFVDDTGTQIDYGYSTTINGLTYTKDKDGNWTYEDSGGNIQPISQAAVDKLTNTANQTNNSTFQTKLKDPSFVKKINDALGTNFSAADLLKMGTAGLGAVLGGSGAFRANNKPVGYQGGIPDLVAEQPMLTAPPTDRRPGSGGINYGTGVKYTDKATGKVVSDTSTSVPDLMALLLANPHNEFNYKYGAPPAATTTTAPTTTTTTDTPKVSTIPDTHKASISSTEATAPTTPTTSTAPAVSDELKKFINWQGSQANQFGTGAISDVWKKQGITDPTSNSTILQNAQDQLDREARRRALTNSTEAAPWQVAANSTPTPEAAAHAAALAAHDAEVAKSSPFVIGGMAKGGLTNLDHGGFVIPADVVSHFGNGSSDAGLKLLEHKLGAKPIRGHGDGMSDSIPASIEGREKALVANEEAYVSPRMVAQLGDGDMDEGSRKLKHMMEKIRKARTGTTEQGKQINANNFMPGGSVGYARGGGIKSFAAGDTVASQANAGVVGTEQNLSSWIGPYVANMLAKAQAEANTPYKAYTGPLTAGASTLQQQAFTNAGNLSVPSSVGQAQTTMGQIGQKAQNLNYTPTQFGNQFNAPAAYQASGAPQYNQLNAGNVSSSFQAPSAYQTGNFANQYQAPAAYQTGNFQNQFQAPVQSAATNFTNQYQAPSNYQNTNFTSGTFDSGAAQQYMNPYLQQSLNPQLEEARRQADITAQQNNAAMTKAGAFGGSRQAILTAENQRNLGTNLSNITGQGYNTAFTNAMGQFNADQARNMQAQQAAEQSKQFGANQSMTAAQMMAQYGMSAQQAQEAARQFNQQQNMTGAQSAAQYGLAAEQAREASRQFGSNQGMTAAQLMAQYGLSAQQAQEASRQFGASQALQAATTAGSQGLQAALANQQAGLTAGQGNINAALEAARQAEASRQFGASQGMTAAQQAAQYGLAGQQASEASRQFGANLGLQGLNTGLQAAQAQGNLGIASGGLNLQNLQQQAALGATQRGIQSEGIAADKAQFDEARKDPFTKLQFQQSMLNGLPITAQNYAMAQPNGLQGAAGGASTIGQLLKALGVPGY